MKLKINIADLQSIYKKIKQESDYLKSVNDMGNPSDFFISIAQYGKYILTNQIILDIINSLPQEAKDNVENTSQHEQAKWKSSREKAVALTNQQICKLASAFFDLKDKDKYFIKDDFNDSLFEYECQVVQQWKPNSELKILKIYEYRNFIDTLHEYLLPRLENFDENEFNNIDSQQTNKNNPNERKAPDWQDDFQLKKNILVFGNYGKVTFISETIINMFKKLTDAMGHWVPIDELRGNKNTKYVRSTISQIEARLSPELKKYITIPSSQHDNLAGKPERQGGI